MARARSIKPGFFKNEYLAECSFAARLCFAGLWTLADREGRLEDRPKRIKGELFAFDSIEVEPLLQELASRGGFILRYRVGDQPLIQILNFGKHQNPHHREAGSALPAPESLGLISNGKAPKPEAFPSSHDLDASDKPEASPGLSPQEVTFLEGKTVLTPDSGLQTPHSLTPDSLFSDPLHSSDHPADGPAGMTGKAKPVKQKVEKTKEPAPTTAVWDAYRDAYQELYKVEPVRNAKVNGQLASFIKRVPIDEAPAIARYYVQAQDNFFRLKNHSVDLLLNNAESLRTRWATNGEADPVNAAQWPQASGRFAGSASVVAQPLMSRRSGHHAFESLDYHAGIGENGKIIDV